MRNGPEVLFCPGCPMAGSFCGVVEEDSLRLGEQHNEHVARYSADHSLTVFAVDEDNMGSSGVDVPFDTRSLRGDYDSDKKLVKEDLPEFIEFLSSEEGRQAIIRRIAECSGYTLFNTRSSSCGVKSLNAKCRALSTSSIIKLKTNNDKEKRTSNG